MKTHSENWSISTLYRRRSKINLLPPYQRQPIWTPDRKRLLADSIVRGIDIPKVYLHQLAGDPYDYAVIDGQQRIRAIWDFHSNNNLLPDDAAPVSGYSIASQRFDQLPEVLQERIEAYQVTVVLIESDDDAEIRDMFVRLQNGVPLKPAEIRHAMTGNMRDLCFELAKHPFFKVCSIHNGRYDREHVAAQLVLLEMGGQALTVSNKVLNKRYKELAGHNFEAGEGKKVKAQVQRVLNFLSEAFPKKMPEFSCYMVISLYLLVSSLWKQYYLGDEEMPQRFRTWFLNFSKRRHTDRLLPVDQQNPEFVKFERASDLQSSIQFRHDVLARDFLMFYPDLPPANKPATFNREQRLAIFRLGDGMCHWEEEDGALCGMELSWDNWHADHIIPREQNGPTVVSNGRILCPFKG